MYHLSDNELDRLSREASEQFEAEQNASGWDALEKKLDKELPVPGRKRRRWFFFILLAGLVILSIPVYIYFHSRSYPVLQSGKAESQQKDVPPRSAQQHPATENGAVAKTDQPGSEIGGLREPSTKEPEDKPAASQPEESPINTRSNSSNKSISSIQKPQISSHSNGSASIQGRRNGGTRWNQLSGTTEIPKNPSGIINRTDAFTSEIHQPDLLKPAVPVRSDMYTIVNHSLPGFIHDNELPDGKNILVNAEGLPKPLPPETRKSKEFTIGVLTGADFSNVNFALRDRSGLNIGITAGYRFAKRWSVNTGFIYTMKRYMAAAEDYHPPKGSWTYYIDLDEVAGDCSMFEIPLSIRYDLFTGKKLRIFANAGLSTYLMHKETYDYFYTYNGEYTHRKRSYTTDDKFWFSIADLSGGIEKSLNKKLTLQVEPYLKMPVKGIGYGNVKLNSYGINFSLRYHLSSK